MDAIMGSKDTDYQLSITLKYNCTVNQYLVSLANEDK